MNRLAWQRFVSKDTRSEIEQTFEVLSFTYIFFQLSDEGIGFNTKCTYTAYDDCSYTFWYAEQPNGIVIKVHEDTLSFLNFTLSFLNFFLKGIVSKVHDDISKLF